MYQFTYLFSSSTHTNLFNTIYLINSIIRISTATWEMKVLCGMLLFQNV
jgi:hypothetical protein